MTVEELIRRVRIRLSDTAEPYLVSDEDLLAFLDEGQREACERGLVLFDTDTPAVCLIDVVAGTASYALDPSILAITRANIGDIALPLTPVYKLDTVQQLSDTLRATGTPRFFFELNNTINLIPTPDADDTLRLKCYRYPLTPITDTGSTLEVAPKHHQALIHYVCHQAYSLMDGELFDKDAAEKELALFESRFGRSRTANELRSWREFDRPSRVRFNLI